MEDLQAYLDRLFPKQQPAFRPTAINSLLQAQPEAEIKTPENFVRSGFLGDNGQQAATQLGLLGLGFAPGAGFSDYAGTFPSAQGGVEPSFQQNVQQGNYLTAGLQGLGALGDAATATGATLGPLGLAAGMGVGSIAKAPRAAQKAVKGLIDSAQTAPKSVMPQVDDLVSVFHGTSPESAGSIERSGFDVNRSADGTIWFTSDPKIGEVAATGKGAVVERLIDEKKLKLGSWKETDKFSTDELIQQGYDGLKLVDGNETTYQIFDPSKLVKPKAVDDLIAESSRLRKKYEANPNQKTMQEYLDAKEAEMFARDQRAVSRAEARAIEEMPASSDYKMQHTAPTQSSGAPLSALDQVYPSDIYSRNAAQLYGDGDIKRDAEVFRVIQGFRNKPDAKVTIYRAVPKDLPKDAKINSGDWVTIDKRYAQDHGLRNFDGNFKVLKKEVTAKDIFTNGDSIYEFGYDPFK
jgi:hypothetical protein